jgi:hypothetical protein
MSSFSLGPKVITLSGATVQSKDCGQAIKWFYVCYDCTGPWGCTVKSVESGVGFPYPEYAIVIPGASESLFTWCLSFSEAFDLIVTSYLL